MSVSTPLIFASLPLCTSVKLFAPRNVNWNFFQISWKTAPFHRSAPNVVFQNGSEAEVTINADCGLAGNHRHQSLKYPAHFLIGAAVLLADLSFSATIARAQSSVALPAVTICDQETA